MEANALSLFQSCGDLFGVLLMLEEACAGCFAPQISGWNDSEGEPIALVFAQEHGAGLGAWQTRTRRGTLTPLILVRIQARLRRNSFDMSASYSPSTTSRPTPLLPARRG